jgi:excisionase family DNA binding protein
MDDLPPMATRNEVAAYLRCNVKLVDKLVKQQELTSHKIGPRRLVISRESVEAYLGRRRAS